MPENTERKISEMFGEIDRKTAVRWAVDCAKHALPLFERGRPDDERPGMAIIAASGWLDGKNTSAECMNAGIAAQESAKEAGTPCSTAAARSAAYAAMAVNNKRHALSAATYGVKAAYLSNGDERDLDNEREWQLNNLRTMHEKIRKSRGHWQAVMKR